MKSTTYLMDCVLKTGFLKYVEQFYHQCRQIAEFRLNWRRKPGDCVDRVYLYMFHWFWVNRIAACLRRRSRQTSLTIYIRECCVTSCIEMVIYIVFVFIFGLQHSFDEFHSLCSRLQIERIALFMNLYDCTALICVETSYVHPSLNHSVFSWLSYSSINMLIIHLNLLFSYLFI